jgi:hypothetical protein
MSKKKIYEVTTKVTFVARYVADDVHEVYRNAEFDYINENTGWTSEDCIGQWRIDEIKEVKKKHDKLIPRECQEIDDNELAYDEQEEELTNG